MEHQVWYQHYDKEVPYTLDYPDITLYEFFEKAVKESPSQTATLFFGAKMEPKSLQRRINITCQSWKRKRCGKSWKFMFFKSEKTRLYSEGIQNSRFCKVSARTGKVIKKPSNMRPTSIPKWMKNQCKIHARKSTWNMDKQGAPNWSPNRENVRKNEVQKSMRKKARPPGPARRVGR